MTIYPMKLKDTPTRFLLVALEHKEPFYIEKNQPETQSVVSALREALDLNKNAIIATSDANHRRILEAKLERPDERAKVVCPDRPEMTQKFWAEQEAVPGLPPDFVRWVAKVPHCSSYRVAFFRSAAFYWVHEQHPRSKEILDTAWRSINEDMEVQGMLCRNARAFLSDLKPKSR